PSGLLEYEVNYKIAQKTKEKLEALGAVVFMSKEEGENMPLARRQEKVLSEQAHLFISLHNNALPDNIDPLARPRGFTFYYYYPHSYTFAEAIERSFVKNIALPDDGILQRDFSVTRSSPQVPAILIEHAYMLLPEQEELLSQDSFIDKLATATSQGVANYISEISKKH
ncbi:MAG: N-acetylmuramoyl-L-alanine amidase, partial [Campylobacter sp.]|nr:N-acetylmuramoyl-L-alanine amidase [Campylobacter sp.]